MSMKAKYIINNNNNINTMIIMATIQCPIMATMK